ncbi:unnamed protein product [Schistosoma rodhaini]|uniref:Uncharacterized protein n=1 Tax=Schistosoma rodhaini TaxID=6188 RepID=A0AA85FRA3_9TREM|nr:unnamed protein product [Schistosoma rodhaini]
MKSSTSGCLAIFCVILLLITTSIYAGSTNGGSQKTRPTKNYAWDFENLYYLNCNISHKKFRCCNYADNLCVGYTGTSFTNSLYSGYEGHFDNQKLRIIVSTMNSTCYKFQQYRTST